MKIFTPVLALTAFALVSAQEATPNVLNKRMVDDLVKSSVWREALAASLGNSALGNAPDEGTSCIASLSSESSLEAWLDAKLNELVARLIGEGRFEQLVELFEFNPSGFISILDLAVYHNLFSRNGRDADEYFFLDGSRTLEIDGVFEDLKSFWDVPSDDILLLGMHGQQLTVDAIFQLYRSAIGEAVMADYVVQEHAQYAHNLIKTTLGFDHPLLTLNAVAFGGDDYATGGQQERIVIGEGIL